MGVRLSDWVECVPNFSEGRSSEVLKRLRQTFEASDVKLLDQTSDPDHHRSVFTIAGPIPSVADALLRAAEVAVNEINLVSHRGEHPRIGALDVVPLVAMDGTSREACVAGANQIAESLWSRLGVPVYLYGQAARSVERQALESIRKLGFEHLREAADSPAYLPDIGGPALHPTAGATCVGVRGFLIAFNVELQSSDVSIARQIAKQVRESSGGLAGVKALGLQLATRDAVQVSMNITDITRTPLHRAVSAVCEAATALGVEVARGELIGLLPRAAAEATSAEELRLEAITPSMILEDRLELWQENAGAGTIKSQGFTLD